MLTDALGQVPAESDVAEVVGVSSKKLRDLLRSVRAPMSMERPRGKGGDEDEETFGVSDSPFSNVTVVIVNCMCILVLRRLLCFQSLQAVYDMMSFLYGALT